MKLSNFLLIFLIFITSTSFGNSIDQSGRGAIYEVIAPGVGSGTGFIVNDSLLGSVLVTCKHVVQDTTGNYVDSILVRRNKLLPSGQTVSDTTKFVVRLKAKNGFYLVKHPNPNVDLVMILILSGFNTTLPSSESIVGFSSSSVLSKETMSQIGIKEGTDVELIGFSLSRSLSPNTIHYHFSRFGKIGLYTPQDLSLVIDKKLVTANYILLDMVIRPGDSGSPIFARIANREYLIGFTKGFSPATEYGIGYPVYYLYDLMKAVKEIFSAVLNQIKK